MPTPARLAISSIGTARPSVAKIARAAGIGEAVRHLAELNHRRIAFIAGPEELHSAQLRQQAFATAMTEVGLPVHPETIARGDHTLEGGTEAMESLLQLRSRPTAVLCSNDMTAIGVLHAAARNGLRVPEDLSVVGFDDIHIARYTIPPLTTIQMSCRDLATRAFEALRAYVENDTKAWRREYGIPTRLTVRQTTRSL